MPLSLHDYDYGEMNSCLLDFLPRDLRNDREIVVAAVKNNPNTIRYLPENMRHDRGIALCALAEDGVLLEYMVKRSAE